MTNTVEEKGKRTRKRARERKRERERERERMERFELFGLYYSI